MSRRPLAQGDLCLVTPRTKPVLGYKILGAYAVEGGDFEPQQTTGTLLETHNECTRSFPYIGITFHPIEAGTPVIVLYPSISVSSSKARSQMGIRNRSTVCEVLIPDEGKIRWVKTGLLRRVSE